LVSGDGRINNIFNESAGTVRALPSKKLTFSLVDSGNENDGTFDLLGGTLEFTDALNNFGKIIGQGNLIVTGGLSNGSLGVITFSGGASQVEGNLTNSANSRVLVTGG